MCPSIPFGRLSLFRPEQDRGSSPPADAFSTLLAHATRQPPIEVFDLSGSGDTTQPGKVSSARPQVRCGHSLLFRCALPPGLHNAQAFLFERDAVGTITLLSHPALLDGAVRYQDVVEVPRTDAMPDGSGAVGTIYLLTPGRSDLLLVCCRDDKQRFDQLKFFRRASAEPRVGPLDFVGLADADVLELAGTVLNLSPESRGIIAGEVELLPEANQPDLIPPSFRGLIRKAQDWPSRRPADTVQSGENGAMLLASQQVQGNIVIPERIKSCLIHQTKLVRHWAEQNGEARYLRQNWRLLNAFEDRLTKVISAEPPLFIDVGNPRPSKADIIDLQSQIAYHVHGLAYHRERGGARAGGRWVVAAEETSRNDGRAPSYLDPYMDNVEPQRVSIPKVDVALIAHCFRTPVEMWELNDDTQFDYWLRKAADGADLFSFGGLAQRDNSFKHTDLGAPRCRANGARFQDRWGR
jgi:hypothetical protein